MIKQKYLKKYDGDTEDSMLGGQNAFEMASIHWILLETAKTTTKKKE